MKKIVIEMLFPEVANLYGDLYNVKYLQQCLEASNDAQPDDGTETEDGAQTKPVEVEVIRDELSREPAFMTREDISFLYMGPMTEHSQELVIRKLETYMERLQELIAAGTLFLMTGNAIEIFGERIDCEDGSSIKALGLFPVYAKRKMFQRYNSLILGELPGMDGGRIVGFKSQFSHLYGDNSNEYLYRVIRGDGMNPESKLEGLRRENFMATYTLGPVLVLNPDLTLYIMKLLGIEQPKLAFEQEARNAYEIGRAHV